MVEKCDTADDTLRLRISQIIGFGFGIGLFWTVLISCVYVAHECGIIGVDFLALRVSRTSIDINFLGALVLLCAISLIINLHQRKGRLENARWWAIPPVAVVALALMRSMAIIGHGTEIVPGDVQISAMLIAFVGFWYGFYGIDGQLGRQALSIFLVLTIVYWCLDLSAIPKVVAEGDPTTAFAGGGLTDSDFAWPFGSAVGFLAAKKLGTYAQAQILGFLNQDSKREEGKKAVK